MVVGVVGIFALLAVLPRDTGVVTGLLKGAVFGRRSLSFSPQGVQIDCSRRKGIPTHLCNRYSAPG